MDKTHPTEDMQTNLFTRDEETLLKEVTQTCTPVCLIIQNASITIDAGTSFSSHKTQRNPQQTPICKVTFTVPKTATMFLWGHAAQTATIRSHCTSEGKGERQSGFAYGLCANPPGEPTPGDSVQHDEIRQENRKTQKRQTHIRTTKDTCMEMVAARRTAQTIAKKNPSRIINLLFVL